IAESRNASVDDRKSVFFLTHEVLGSVLSTLNVSFPSSYKKPADLNTTYGDLHNVLPAGLKAADVAATKPFAANGVAQTFWSRPLWAEDEPPESKPGSAGRGWVSLEVILVRLNQTLAGSGAQFGMVANVSDDHGNFGNVGFDMGVCVERFDPYVVEVYQGLTSVRSTSIIRQADDLTVESGQRRSLLVSPGTTSQLSSEGKYAAYEVAHENARNALIKDNGRDHAWVPNPTLTSMSSGAGGGPAGYGVLDPVRLADMLASADWLAAYKFLRIGGAPVEDILFRTSTTQLPMENATSPDRKTAARFLANFHQHPHHRSRLSTARSGGDAGEVDIERSAPGAYELHPRPSDERTRAEGPLITLNEIEKRLTKQPVSYAVPHNPNLDGGTRRREIP
ncbi:unnamed protein product, partial [Tilletia caries]